MAEAEDITLMALDIDGVLTDGRVLYTADGQEQKLISFRDIDAIAEAARQGLKVALITGEDNEWVDAIHQRLQIEHVIRGAKDKLVAVQGLAQQLNIPLSAICYVGDSDRDAPALAAVGLGAAPADATAPARASAQLVLKSNGGQGAVREILTYLLEKKDAKPKPDKPAPLTGGLDHDIAARQARDIVKESLAVQQAIAGQLLPSVLQAADMILTAIKGGHKILIFGNGGSAADAQHMAAELVSRFEKERAALPAVALTTDTSILTALANDYGYDVVFARQIEAVGSKGDIAVAISTSGNSPSVLEGVRTAGKAGMPTIGIMGKDGGQLAGLVDLCLCAPSSTTARIQEAHGLIIHLLCGLVEANIAGA